MNIKNYLKQLRFNGNSMPYKHPPYRRRISFLLMLHALNYADHFTKIGPGDDKNNIGTPSEYVTTEDQTIN